MISAGGPGGKTGCGPWKPGKLRPAWFL